MARFVLFAAIVGLPLVPSAYGAAQSVEPEIDAEAASEGESRRMPVLVMMIGGGARFRNIHLELEAANGASDTRSYETGGYFDFGWHLFIRPLARRSTRPALQAISLQIDGGSGIGLNAEPDMSGIELQTNAWRMVGQFGYLYPIGRFQVGGLTGVGGDVLSVDLNSVLPSSRIIYVRVGPAALYEIVAGYLGIRADFGVRAPFYYGGLRNAFGDDSRGVGLDGAVTLDGQIKAGFSYMLRFLWEYYRLSFRGTNENVPAMGGNGNGDDHAFAIQVLLGWSL